MSRTTEELLEVGDRHNTPSYAPARMILERGEGVWVWDKEGNKYLDFVAGIAVNALGHANQKLVSAIQEQAAKLMHVSNMFYSEPQVELMERLCDLSFADRTFLCNSGTEATEASIKLARRYQYKNGTPEKFEIITMNKSFHGRTYAAMSATGQPKYQKGYEPIVPGFKYADFNDLDSVRALVGPNTGAIMVEPVQGEGGVRPSAPGFLEGLREICDANGALLIFDEVQCGVGRTGSVFGYQAYGVEPDIMALAKGLGGGFPVGAMLATENAFQGFERGSHASTFGGNPLASAAANVILEEVSSPEFLTNVRDRGAQLVAGLKELASTHSVIEEVRGLGLMVGAQCEGDAAGEIYARCREEGLLINTAGGTTLRFVPPLIVTQADVSEALSRLGKALELWAARSAA